jgi:hypothetical protein
MIFPTDAQQWIGRFVVLEWQLTFTGTTRRIPTNGGGRVLRVDDVYLYLQPFGLAAPSAEGETITKLGLKIEEQKIPLVDIDTIYLAPLDGIQIVE